MVSPVTHSVGNCVKRVVVIASSILFFKTPVSPLNSIGNLTNKLTNSIYIKFSLIESPLVWWARVCFSNIFNATGTATALAGVYLYTRAKKVKPNPNSKSSWNFLSVWFLKFLLVNKKIIEALYKFLFILCFFFFFGVCCSPSHESYSFSAGKIGFIYILSTI